MSNENIYSAVVTDKKTLKIYDEICGAMFVNLYTRSKDWETIDLANFDPKNEEHLFVLGVAKGVASSFDKKVVLDVSKFQLWKLNRGIDKDCRLILINGKEAIYSIDPEELLAFMRPKAIEACGEDFTFADIYNQYYNRKKVK
jgi:hypothetical protein